MMDAGFKPQSKVMQAIFVRKHSADSAELASGEAGNADRRRHTIDGDVGCLPLRRRDEGRERTQSFQGYDKTKPDEEATMARI